MKNCTGCKWAKWQRTKTFNLHPSGDGRCTKMIEIPALPAAFYWRGYNSGSAPSPSGGYINRHKDHDDNCPCYEAT